MPNNKCVENHILISNKTCFYWDMVYIHEFITRNTVEQSLNQKGDDDNCTKQ